MDRKAGETVHELAARIRQDAVTCDCHLIKDALDEAMNTRFLFSLNNEAYLKEKSHKINYLSDESCDLKTQPFATVYCRILP